MKDFAGPQWRTLVPLTPEETRRLAAFRASEAGSSAYAVDFFERSAREAAGLLNTRPDQLPARVATLQDEIKKLRKQLQKGAAADVKSVRVKLLEDAERIDGSAVIVGEMGEVPVAQLREAADWLRSEAGSAAMCLATRADGKPLLIAAVTEDLIAKGVKAGDLIKHVAGHVDGRGGGRPNLAQAGGTNPDGIPDALTAAAEWIKQKLT